MKRSLLPLFFLAAGLCSAPSVLAATTPRGLVADDLTVGPPVFWRHGALLVRAEVRNPTASPQRVRVRYGDGSSSSGLATAFADLEVPAGGRSLCEIALPRAHHYGSDRVYAIDASGKETVVAENVSDFRHWTNGYEPAFYVSRSLSGERLRDQLKTVADDLKNGGSFGSAARYGQDFSPRAARAGDFAEPWPGDWRAYSAFAGVFVAERDLPDLPPPAKAALRDYAAAGGCVFFVGAAELPAEFADAPFASFAAPVANPDPALAAVPAEVPAAARCGLGLLAALPAAVAETGGASALSRELGSFVLRHVLRTAAVLDDPAGLAKPLAGVPPPSPSDLGRPPVGLFLLLLLAFSVLAGPVALWILARRNRRIHILWVLPAVSAVFSLAIVLSLLLREGVAPSEKILSGVLLDQRAGRAVALASASFYSPLTLGGLDLPADAAVTPGEGYRGGTVRVGRAARYEGWIAPRTPGAFLLSSVRATPLRLDVREDPATGGVEAVNAFGVPVEKLWLLDGAGALRAASDVAPGATVALAPAGEDERKAFAERSGDLSAALGCGAVPLQPDVLSRPAPPARRFYVAVLPAFPFEPDPLAGRKAARDGRTIVYGVY